MEVVEVSEQCNSLDTLHDASRSDTWHICIRCTSLDNMAAANQHAWRSSRGGEGFTSGFHFYLYTYTYFRSLSSPRFRNTLAVVSHFWRLSVAITDHLVAMIHDRTQRVWQYAVLLRAFTSSKIIAVVPRKSFILWRSTSYACRECRSCVCAHPFRSSLG